ncbi:MAG: flagellar biosynthesis protein FlhA [Planctomycetes bacterium]|nr:flagellar biosynthesis protein FlhA [Planctomycetota bacterium]
MPNSATVETHMKSGAQAILRHGDWILGGFVISIIVVLVASMPPFLLDIAIATNIALGVAILLVSLNTRNLLEFATFPTLLLFTTLARLAINVASTRSILQSGQAGALIDAFGKIVVGGNIVIGLVVFSILLVIQFVVITKGSSRISEVAARFTLDAMPGKQMAIDADLGAGVITNEEAKIRRETIAREAEFYGAMDGAGKFVRGDAVAGLLITIINLVGGVIIGVVMDKRGISEALHRYAVLSVGDGLVSQIPALLISTASGVIVTKTAMESRLSKAMAMPFLTSPRALVTTSAVLGGIGLIPGLPMLPFVILSGFCYIMYLQTRDVDKYFEQDKKQGAGAGKHDKTGAGKAHGAGAADGEPAADHKKVDDLLAVDRLSVEIGYRLIPLVDPGGGAGILDHIAQLRRQFATTEGFVVPPVRIRDNMRLDPNAYRILVNGEAVANGQLQAGHLLAMDASGRAQSIPGIATTEPVFGLPAKWIAAAARQDAELLGYTIIEPVSVLVTHVTEILRNHAHEIITRDDVKHLLETVKKKAPAVVDELVPGLLTIGDIQKVLRNLLRERISIKHLSQILETLADNAGQTKDTDKLTELARTGLGRAICERAAGADEKLYAVTLEPPVEARIAGVLTNPADAGGPSAGELKRIVEQTVAALNQASLGGREPVLLVRGQIRKFIRDLIAPTLPRTFVLSYQEAQSARSIESLSVVRLNDAAA